MASQKTTNKGLIKKPRLVLNNTAKFYLATHEVNPENPSDWFFFISLYYPIDKKHGLIQIPQTEITTFDDAESAAIYYETMVHYCEFNSGVQYDTAVFPYTKKHIKDFYELIKQKEKQNAK